MPNGLEDLGAIPLSSSSRTGLEDLGAIPVSRKPVADTAARRIGSVAPFGLLSTLTSPTAQRIGQLITSGGQRIGQSAGDIVERFQGQPQPTVNPPGITPRVQAPSDLSIGLRSILPAIAETIPSEASKFITPEALAAQLVTAGALRGLAGTRLGSYPLEKKIPFLKRFSTPEILAPLVRPRGGFQEKAPIVEAEIAGQPVGVGQPKPALVTENVPATIPPPALRSGTVAPLTSVGAQANPGYVLMGQPFDRAIIAYENKFGQGTFDKLSPKAQLEVISNAPEAKSVKTLIQEATNQVPTGKPIQEAVALRRSLRRQEEVARKAGRFAQSETINQISRLFSEPRRFLKVAQQKFLTPTQVGRIARLQRVEPGATVSGPRGGTQELPLTQADLIRIASATRGIVPRPGFPTGTPPRIPRKKSLVPTYPKAFKDLNAYQASQTSGLEPRRAARIVDQSDTGPTTARFLSLRDSEISAGKEWQSLNSELIRISGNIKPKSELAKQVTDLLEGTIKAQPLPKSVQVAAWWRKEADSLLDRVNQLRASQGKSPIMRRENYMTHLQDSNFWTELRATVTGEDAKNLKTLGDFVPELFQPGSRFFKPRKGGEYAIDPIKAFRVYSQSLLRVIHASEPARLLKVHAEQLPPNARKYFERVIKQSVTGFKGEISQAIPRPLSKALSQFTSRFSRGTVLGNASSVVMQPWTLPATMSSLNKPQMAGVAAKWIAEGKGGEFAMQWSKTLQGRSIEGLEPSLLTNYARLEDKLAGAMTAVDRYMVAHSFTSHYLDQVALGKSHAEAVGIADSLTALQQAEFLRSTLAPIFADEAARAFVPFQTTVNSIFNYMKVDITKSSHPWRAAALFAGTIAAMSAIYDALGLPRPKGIADWIPGLSSLRGGPPVIRIASDAVIGLSSPVESERERAVGRILRSLGVVVFGPPANQAIKSIAGLRAVAQGGNFTASGRMRFPVKGLPEQARAIFFGPYQTKAGQAYIERGFKPEPLTLEQKIVNRRIGILKRQ